MTSTVEIYLKDGRTIRILDASELTDAPSDMLFIQTTDRSTSYLIPNSQIVYMKETRNPY